LPWQRLSYILSSTLRSLAQDACKSGDTGTTTRTRVSDAVCSILGGVWLVFCHRVSGRRSANFEDMAIENIHSSHSGLGSGAFQLTPAEANAHC
jgi:hypothetical protein